jgi:hypothetical protein
MTRTLTVARNGLDQFEIRDSSGKLVEGPFETNAAAWKALDRLDHQNADVPDKRRSSKPVLWGQPEPGKSKKQLRREQKIAARQDKQMQRNARKAVGWVRNIASVKFDPLEARKFKDHKLGTFGPASAVKHIDPAEYLAEKVARGER